MICDILQCVKVFIHYHCFDCGFPLALVQGAYTLADDVKALIRQVYARLGRLTLGVKRVIQHQTLQQM